MFKKILLFSAFLWMLFSIESNAQWQPLFNGKDLNGWKQLNGNAKFEAKNGEIVGTTVIGEPNSFLATEKTYKDFRMKFQVMLEAPINSGVQFRSESKASYQNGRVHGYQFEIDPTARAWSGGIYDEARREWLYPVDLNEPARKVIPLNQWIDCEIACKGNEIRTYINGNPVAYLVDDMTPEGFIALQVHDIGNDTKNEGKKIRWRNLQINVKPFQWEDAGDQLIVNLIPNTLTEQEKRSGYKLLFDGKTTAGWRGAYKNAFPEKGWQIGNGEITVLPSGGGESTHGGDIVTTDKYGSFIFLFEFKMTQGANSGVKYFVTETEGNTGSAIGLEYQILDDKVHPDANQGSIGNRKLASLYDLIPAIENPRARRPVGEWNRGIIIVKPDGLVEHYLNGYKLLHYERGSQYYKALVAKSKYANWPEFGMAPEGRILLQDHGDKVSFRNIKIRELK